jgi:uncharacterized protein
MQGVAPTVIRVAEPLRFFLSARHRQAPASAPADGVSSLVHIVESLGIPRTEVGGYLVDGQPRDRTFRPQGGESVEILAIERPQPTPTTPPRFAADVHLGALARRLRLLGVDVTYRNDFTDDDLVAEAAHDQRAVLTKDRGLLRRRALLAGAFVRGQDVAAQVSDVLDRFAVPTFPFSRCLRCNGRLEAVSKDQVENAIPDGTRRSYDDFSQCIRCRQVYWRGAHADALDRAIAAAGTDRRSNVD